ncbi:MAG: hypothetical protein M3M95_02700 [Pseudomonadota bacterium]|nr:hypothetical protein [Pseudomonadota bacterium]
MSALNRRTFLGGLLLPPCGAQGAVGTPAVLKPPARVRNLPGLARFRAGLAAVAAARNPAGLRALLAPDVKSSFGGDDTVAEFERRWRTQDRSSPVWSVLDRIERLGGVAEGSARYTAPYVHANWPDAFDPFEHVLAVGPRAVMRAKPSFSSVALRGVTHRILRLESAAPGGWTRVRDGARSGWLQTSRTWSPVGPRLIAERRGRWLITALVEGD